MKKLFTSESVSEGHPDKIADQISDAILDEIIKQDKKARVAVETYVKTGLILVGGEVTTTAIIDYESIARGVVEKIGYNDSKKGFDYKTCAFINNIGKQSPDINIGVDKEKEEKQGAGDQGIMFGYATNETEELLPAPILYSHKLMQKHKEVKNKNPEILRPDAKAQITFEYNKDNTIKRIDTIVLSSQHSEKYNIKYIRDFIKKEIINKVIPDYLVDDETRYLINPTGIFVIGGPMGDAGLTGRKIIVDTYGGSARHGGGAFSGKDPSKVDRSAAYAARHVAKNIVAAELADRCEVQLSYAIGVSKPISINIETFGTNKIPEQEIVDRVLNCFDLTPFGIQKELNLLEPIYLSTATFGHFTDQTKKWEQLNKVKLLINK